MTEEERVLSRLKDVQHRPEEAERHKQNTADIADAKAFVDCDTEIKVIQTEREFRLCV